VGLQSGQVARPGKDGPSVRWTHVFRYIQHHAQCRYPKPRDRGQRRRGEDGFTCESGVHTFKSLIQSTFNFKVSRKAPSLRLLSNQEKRHIVSCSADEAIWGPLVAKDPSIAVHTPELVLRSGLRQEVDWDSLRLEVEEDGL
jgi:hypothetical protein